MENSNKPLSKHCITIMFVGNLDKKTYNQTILSYFTEAL